MNKQIKVWFGALLLFLMSSVVIAGDDNQPVTTNLTDGCWLRSSAEKVIRLFNQKKYEELNFYYQFNWGVGACGKFNLPVEQEGEWDTVGYQQSVVGLVRILTSQPAPQHIHAEMEDGLYAHYLIVFLEGADF